METVLSYRGESESFKELDLLLSSTSGLGEGFLQPIRQILWSSLHVDKPGVEEQTRELLKEFNYSFTKRVQIFSPIFMSQIYALIDKGISEHCEVYPIIEYDK